MRKTNNIVEGFGITVVYTEIHTCPVCGTRWMSNDAKGVCPECDKDNWQPIMIDQKSNSETEEHEH